MPIWILWFSTRPSWPLIIIGFTLFTVQSPFRKETHQTLYIDRLLSMLCAERPFQFEHVGLLPFWLEFCHFRAPQQGGGCLDHVSALSGPVGALRSLKLASSSLSTSLPLSTVAFMLVTFWKEQKSTVGFCFCFYKDTHTYNSHIKVLPRFLFSPFQYLCCGRSTIRPISKQVFFKGKKVFSPFGPFPCFLEKQLKVTSGNFPVPLLRF